MPKRMPAVKVRIKDIVMGKFFFGNAEELKPAYVITRFGQKVCRVNILATVVDKFVNEAETYATISLDDGTEAIRAKLFRERVRLAKEIEVGDLVIVIGKLKQFNSEIYVNAEIVRKVSDPNYEMYRKLEILRELRNLGELVKKVKELKDKLTEDEFREELKRIGLDEESARVIIESEREEVDYKPTVLELIEKLDEGDGVEISKLFEVLSLPEEVVESVITDLLASGYLYEPEPGKFKKV